MMKKVAKIFVCGLAMTAVCMASAEAQDLKDLLNGLGDVVKETVAQNKTVTVAELKGTWKTTGPALVLKSGNIAQQAGGSAMTTAAEAKLKPYYKKLGLLNTSCVFDSEGNFTLTVKKAPIKGKLTANSDGTFKMQLLSTIAGLTNDEHSMTVYVQKVGNEMSISMDVKKLMTIVQAVAKKGDLKTINTVTSIRPHLHRLPHEKIASTQASMKRVSQRRLFFLFFVYLRTYKLTDMKKLILLIVLAAAAYGGYKIWISDGEVLNDYIGEENVTKAKEHLSALTDKPATADTATIAANWFATGPAVYLKSGNAVGNLSGEAVAAIAENRLTPYYEQLQLDDTHIEFSDENTFVIFVRDVPVEGRLDRISGNSYNLSLHSSQVRIPAAYSNQKAYLQKDGNRMTLTVDVKQLIGLVSAVADNADNATFKMAMRLTRQYDNVCLGFHFKRAEHPGK